MFHIAALLRLCLAIAKPMKIMEQDCRTVNVNVIFYRATPSKIKKQTPQSHEIFILGNNFVLHFSEGINFRRKDDSQTGFPELVVCRNEADNIQ